MVGVPESRVLGWMTTRLKGLVSTAFTPRSRETAAVGKRRHLLVGDVVHDPLQPSSWRSEVQADRPS
jgi:hypothetical protein